MLFCSKLCVIELIKIPPISSSSFSLHIFYFSHLSKLLKVLHVGKLLMVMVDQVQFGGYPTIPMDEYDEVYRC